MFVRADKRILRQGKSPAIGIRLDIFINSLLLNKSGTFIVLIFGNAIQ